MKNIKFELSFSKQRKYELYLGFGDRLISKNKKKLERYLSTYKAVIKDNVYLLAQNQSQIESIYWDYYMQFDSSTQRIVQYELNNFKDRFDYIFKTFSRGNQNAFVFRNITSCFDSQMTCLQALKEFSFKYKIANLKQKVTALIKHHESLEQVFELERHRLDLTADHKKRTKVITLVNSKVNE
ncbi:hypothetical protein GWK08_08885 [Leptobacterium flavescens]|uniref:Uncharacterized protein n=1 Tax=Leptobacterium flavescens TaxID=472055 RepID=A0A6P0UNX6_9FLAO|nr:hypothetical protein [Leptobacterium flavescens]NER13549.1 hypothetical protein [Leptobacterium flavescens]